MVVESENWLPVKPDSNLNNNRTALLNSWTV